jgi:transposase-like protein
MKRQSVVKFNSDKELSEYLLSTVGSNLKQAIKTTVEVMLKLEMRELRENLEQKLEERERLYFNGSYPRHLVSSAGKVENIAVPRFRGGNGEIPIQGMQLFDEERQRFFDLVAQMHLTGVSQRKIGTLCREYFGHRVSPRRVGKVYRELVEQESFQINEQPLDDDYMLLVVDGIWEKVYTSRIDGETNKMVMLCVLGIRANGERKMLGFQLAKSEAMEEWLSLLQSIKSRGLTGTNLTLIVCDGAEGSIGALDQVYPGKPLQLCLAHKVRNVMSKVSHKYKKAVGEDFSKIYNSTTFEEAKQHCKEFEQRWFVISEKAVRSLKHRFEMYFTFFNYNPALWKVIRTTNVLEREFREVRRRTKVFDNYFQSPDSANRYHNGIFTYLNNHYPRRDMVKQLLHTVC